MFFCYYQSSLQRRLTLLYPMKHSPALPFFFLLVGATTLAAAQIPHLEKRGAATQLIVADKPWLILGGEIAHTASSSLPYMETVRPRLARLNLNIVVEGRWNPGRQLSGDAILLNYRLARQAELNQSGSGLRFGPDSPTLQRVKLYRDR